MTYEEYIASPPWRRLRRQALERDGHRCRLCNAGEDLEVHHRAYPPAWDQDSVDHLTTLCHDCHGVITAHLRARRYQRRTPQARDICRITPVVEVTLHEIPNLALQDSWRGAAVDAQRAISRSAQRDRQAIEEVLLQVIQNGGRPRRDGPA